MKTILSMHDDVRKMNMTDLMVNHFFIKDGEAWYRDFEREVSVNDLMRELHGKYTTTYDTTVCNDCWSEMLFEHTQYGTDNLSGVIAMFNFTLCGAAMVRDELMNLRRENSSLKAKAKLVDKIIEDDECNLKEKKDILELLLDDNKFEVRHYENLMKAIPQNGSGLSKHEYPLGFVPLKNNWCYHSGQVDILKKLIELSERKSDNE
jgi:hypothetical protein